VPVIEVSDVSYVIRPDRAIEHLNAS